MLLDKVKWVELNVIDRACYRQAGSYTLIRDEGVFASCLFLISVYSLATAQ